MARIILLGVLAITTLVGCTTAPGSNISSRTFENALWTPQATDLEVSRLLITPTLVKQLQERKKNREINTPKNFDVKTVEGGYSYRIGPGDVISIVVWDHPELTAPFGSFNNAEEQGNVVREDGTIYYPFIGAVQAEGRTALEIRNEMEVRLAKFIEAPQIDVRIAGYRSQRFLVAGAVKRPGNFSITDIPLTIIDAINSAGGLSEDADLFDVRLTRGETTTVTPLYEMLFEGDATRNVVLQHGDVVHVAPNELRRAFVLGEVREPQSLALTNRPLSLTQALATVGGIQEARADGHGVYVIRQSEFDGVVDVYQLDISEAWMLALGDKFILEPRDIVYVSPAPITRWNRWVSNVLPSLQGIYNIDRIGQN